MKRKIINRPRAKHIPQRTCVACRKVKAKQELIRLVCGSNNNVEVDSDVKKAGRGAYLCRAQQCWELGLKNGRLENTLRTKLNQVNREQLLRFIGELLMDSWENQTHGNRQNLPGSF